MKVDASLKASARVRGGSGHAGVRGRPVPGAIKLLLVEDRAADVHRIKALLSSVEGVEFSVTSVGRMDEGLERLGRGEFQAVLLDLSLPDGEGVWVLERFCAASRTPVVVLNGAADELAEAEAVMAGAQDYLVKGKISATALHRTIRNAIERRHSIDRLVASEVRFRELAEGLQDIIFRYQLVPQKGFEYVNGAVEEITGYTPQEYYDDPGLHFRTLHPADRRELEEAFLRPDGSHDAVGRLFHKDGSVRWIEQRCMPILDGAKALIAVSGVIRDVTALKRSEEEIWRDTQRHWKGQRLESVGRLAGGVAHDFNNALTVIIGYGQILEHRLEGRPAEHKMVKEMIGASHRAANLTRKLLAYSRKQVMKPTITDLNRIVEGMSDMIAKLVGEDIEIVQRLKPDISQVLVDGTHMEQVLMNLAANARDAMPDGGRLTVETENAELDGSSAMSHEEVVVKAGRYVRLTVSDTGTGIDPAIKEAIFEPFFTTKRAGKGTGLGLAMVYGIVKQSGGYVFMFSELGQGSTFKLYFPAVGAEPLPPAPAPVAEDIGRRGTETILLVEDEGNLRDLAERVLSEHGYRVLSAANAAAAVEIDRCFEGAIDLLLTDVVMPGMSGRDLARAISKSRDGCVKAAYMSGYTDDVIAKEGVLEPGVALLEKPFSTARLLEFVRRVLDGAMPSRVS